MYAVMHRFQKTTAVPHRNQQVTQLDLRSPPLHWRRWIVGVLLAMPGAIGGLILALAFPPELAPLLAIAGALAGLRIGFMMESR